MWIAAEIEPSAAMAAFQVVGSVSRAPCGQLGQIVAPRPSGGVRQQVAASDSVEQPTAQWEFCGAVAGAIAAKANAVRGQRKQKRRQDLVIRLQVPTEFNEYKDAVVIEEATVRLGADEILTDVDLSIPRGARGVIVGPNGCGKTTLLSVISGLITPERGAIAVTSSIGWLRQEAVGGSTRTVYEEAVSQMEATKAYTAVEEATVALSEAKDDREVASAQARYDAASEKFESLGGWDIEQKATEVLLGLSFSKEDFNRPCSELSGGWQMKVGIARALLRSPNLLLLDEPTNHMDTKSKEWLANYLAEDLPRTTSLLIVTHDKGFLEKVRLSCVVEISEKRLMTYQCKSIEEWETLRKGRLASLELEIGKLMKQNKADQEYVSKWGAKAAFASLAQSRKKDIERRNKELAKLRAQTRGLPSSEDLVKTDKAVQESDGMLPLASLNRVVLKLPEAPLGRGGPLDSVLVKLKDADIGYSPELPTIVGNVQFPVRSDTRIALLGPNGCGKTTLLRSLAGIMDVKSGERALGEGPFGQASVAFFTQDLAQDLPSDETPVDYLIPVSGSEENARSALGALGLKSAVHKSMIGSLSGGEKARVALAMFVLSPSDVLLLDEPTNHLDGVAVKALAEGLRTHSRGAVVVSTHDEAFIEALQVTHVAKVTKGTGGQPGAFQLQEADKEERQGARAAPEASTPTSAPATQPKAAPRKEGELSATQQKEVKKKEAEAAAQKRRAAALKAAW